ncbi:MAG: hypothetical protein JNK63_09800 [Chthonomonas sp.]|nr:hypothetical protein [Chthonomonas sp.]
MSILLEPEIIESSLPERQMVWCIQGKTADFLCTTWDGYILVFRSQEDCEHHKRHRSFNVSRNVCLAGRAFEPISLSLESVIQHAREQRPSQYDGSPCRGYVWKPGGEKVEVS